MPAWGSLLPSEETWPGGMVGRIDQGGQGATSLCHCREHGIERESKGEGGTGMTSECERDLPQVQARAARSVPSLGPTKSPFVNHVREDA